jgi:hypothetical protein
MILGAINAKQLSGFYRAINRDVETHSYWHAADERAATTPFPREYRNAGLPQHILIHGRERCRRFTDDQRQLGARSGVTLYRDQRVSVAFSVKTEQAADPSGKTGHTIFPQMP